MSTEKRRNMLRELITQSNEGDHLALVVKKSKGKMKRVQCRGGTLHARPEFAGKTAMVTVTDEKGSRRILNLDAIREVYVNEARVDA